MRSFNKAGAALVAVFALVVTLAGCSQPPAEETFEGMSCEQVTTALAAERESLSESKSSAKGIEGTAAAANFEMEVEASEAKIEVLKDAKELKCSTESEDEEGAEPASDSDDDSCKPWEMSEGTYTDNRWLADGIESIRTAVTPEDAADAAHDWMTEIRTDPGLLLGAARYVYQQTPERVSSLTREQLVDKDGCASDVAVDLVIEMELKLADAKSIIVEAAPETGYNSGATEDGTVVAEATPGVSGDRAAIKVTLRDGTVFWIMARCGNIVVENPPPVPTGPTDNPPRPECKPPYPDGTWPFCKDEATQDAGPRGNAPDGQGLNADPGPGAVTIDPVQPGPEPRVNPAEPAPVVPEPAPSTPGQPAPAPVPTADPAPPPPPEPTAPEPTAPATVCDPTAPGATCPVP